MLSREVALLVETSTTFGQNVLLGIAAYLRENGPWRVRLEHRSTREPPPPWLDAWRGDGVISRIPDPAIGAFARRTGIPVVDLNEQVADLGLPMIFNDQGAIGRMAAEHLLERGFTQFAYIGQRGVLWSDERGEAFARRVGKDGFSCQAFLGRGRSVWDYRQRIWETEFGEVAEWAAALQKPVGVMACNAFRALQLLEACESVNVAVPEQLAVIAGDNAAIACEMATPTLSAVINNAFRIGYEAAQLLERLMNGEQPEVEQQRIAPQRVVTRGSTDITAINDPVVAHAVRFIRQHACAGMQVDDVLREVRVSRSTLQKRTRKALNRTVHDLIIAVQLDRARQLLTETSLRLDEIAQRTGFRHVQYLSDVFKQRTGVRPGAYRKQASAR
jgi:LacI family transcriptional regulator